MESKSLELEDADLDGLDLDDEPGEPILSPAQRSMRCAMTLFCVAVLSASLFQFSNLSREGKREASAVTTAVQPKAKVQEKQDTRPPRLAANLTSYFETSEP
jgi:hypothetical protein